MKSVPNYQVKWGGFMLDEEPGYGFSASQLESLNSYVSSVMSGVSSMAWYCLEGQPNGWDAGTYSSILGGNWPALQAYSSSMVSAINTEANSYVHSVNMLTIENSAAYPWDDYAWVANQVTGTNWSNCDWGCSIYFDNQYVYP